MTPEELLEKGLAELTPVMTDELVGYPERGGTISQNPGTTTDAAVQYAGSRP